MPCTSASITYVDINCKINRQTARSLKSMKDRSESPHCPHTLCSPSSRLWSNKKTARTDTGATPLFLKLGEFFPWTVIRILMMFTVTAGGRTQHTRSSSFSGATQPHTPASGNIETGVNGQHVLLSLHYKTVRVSTTLKSAMLLCCHLP